MAIIVKEFVGKGNIKKIDEKITKTIPKKTTKKNASHIVNDSMKRKNETKEKK